MSTQDFPDGSRRHSTKDRRTATVRGLLAFEWRCTYRSARRDGYTRRTALRKFAREVAKGIPERNKP